jgi:hypothetical protein
LPTNSGSIKAPPGNLDNENNIFYSQHLIAPPVSSLCHGKEEPERGSEVATIPYFIGAKRGFQPQFWHSGSNRLVIST